jgi:thioesterase-3
VVHFAANPKLRYLTILFLFTIFSNYNSLYFAIISPNKYNLLYILIFSVWHATGNNVYQVNKKPIRKDFMVETISEIKIRGYHVDHFNHVNNARYLEFLEEGRWDYSEQNGLIDAFHERGITHVTVKVNINYRRSAVVGQILKIETRVVGISNKSFTMGQKIFLHGSEKLIADAKVTNVLLDIYTAKTLPINATTIDFWPDLVGNHQQ